MSEINETSWLHRARHTPFRDWLRLRLSGRLDWRGVIDAAEIPTPAKGMLRKLVRRTRLWRLEKADVARDLVSHFEDALADGRPVDEVIETFGDWRKVAKLTRRAMKRKRPWVWHAWRWSLRSIAGLIVLYIGLGLYYMTGTPKITQDYVPIINKKATAVPVDERAWPVVRDALLAMGLDEPIESGWDQKPDAEKTMKELLWSQSRPGDARWDTVVAYYRDNEQAIADLHRAAKMPGLGFVADYGFDQADLPLFVPNTTAEAYAQKQAEAAAHYRDNQPPLYAVLLPHISSIRDWMRILSIEVFLRADQGDAQGTYESLAALLRVGPFAAEQNTIINQMIDVSIRSSAMQVMSELIFRYPDLLSNQQLQDLAHQVATLRQYTFDLSGEKLMMLDAIQHIYTDDGHGNGHLDYRAWAQFANEMLTVEDTYEGRSALSIWVSDYALSPAVVLYAVDRREMVRMTEYHYSLAAKDQTTPIWEQPESLSDQALIQLEGEGTFPWSRYGVLTSAMASLGSLRSNAHRYMAKADGVLTGLALELYRRDHGDYPDTLDTLVPHYLPEVPIDRITGDPIRYRVVDGRPIVYSVGADRDDDGGTILLDKDGQRDRAVVQWLPSTDGEPPADGDWVVWPLHEEHKTSDTGEQSAADPD